MNKRHNTKDLAQGQWFSILTRLGMDGGLLNGKHHAFPEVGATTDGFRFIDRMGDGYCSLGQGRFVDGFGLLKEWQGYNFKEAANAIDDVMGWAVGDYTPPTPAERAAIDAAHEKKAKKREQALQAEYQQVSEQCSKKWGDCQDVEGNANEYLKNKGVQSYGLKVDNAGNLLVPVHQDAATISSLQTINANGKKRFTPKGKIGGGYFYIKGLPPLVVVEGYATGASIHEATGNSVMVAFNAGNLGKVASMVRAKMPDIEIIIAADNDKKTDKNTGLEAALEAAQAVGALVTFPAGKDGSSVDWNDIHTSQGIEVIRAGIANALEPDALMNILDGRKSLPCAEPDKTTLATPLPTQEKALAVDSMPSDSSIDKPKQGEDAFDPIGSVVARLATLSELEYDQVRSSEAEALGVRAATLDKEVKKERKAANAETNIFEEVEPWGEVVDGKALLDDVADVFNRYAVLPAHAPEVAALWILNTYVHDAAYNSPMIMITSPEKRCGKTTTLNLFQSLVHKPLPAANISAAAIYRAIEEWTPTLLIDEADTFLKNNEEVAGVINSGHTKLSSFVVRCDGDDNKPKRFSTWCPKIIAGIGSQRDTLEDRSIIFPLRRKLPHETVEWLRLDLGGFDELKQKCVRWAADNFTQCKHSEPMKAEGLDDRANDNWRPLLTIADLCGWSDKARNAAVLIRGEVEESESIDTILLKDIQNIFKEQQAARLSSRRICDLLAAIEDRPWGEWSKGRPITTNKLSGRLKMFGIHTKTLRLPNGDRLKGYELTAFSDSFGRYCISKRDIVTSEQYQQKQASQSVTSEERVTVEKAEEVSNSNGCHVVTVQTPTFGII